MPLSSPKSSGLSLLCAMSGVGVTARCPGHSWGLEVGVYVCRDDELTD